MNDALPWIDPTAGTGKAKTAFAPRPMDLAGKVVGQLDNTKDQGDEIFMNEAAKWRAVARKIEELHEDERPVLVGTTSIARPASPRRTPQLRPRHSGRSPCAKPQPTGTTEPITAVMGATTLAG